MDLTIHPNLTMIDENSSVPLYGLPGATFYVIHIEALSSLSLSLVASGSVLANLFVYQKHINMWKKPIVERLIVYLATADFLYRYLIFGLDCFDISSFV